MSEQNQDINSSVSIFEKIQTNLNQAGYDTYLMPKNDENAVEQLLISISEKTEEKSDVEHVTQLMFVNDFLEASNIETGKSDYLIAQFFTTLPFKLKQEKILELYQLLSVFNRIVPVGYFGISDEEGAFHRYSVVTKGREIDPGIVTEIISMISFFVNRIAGKLSALAAGEKNLAEVLAELEQVLG